MATEIEWDTIEKLSEAVSALSLNVARLTERLDAQKETLTEAIRASQEETRRIMAEQNAAQSQELHAAIERVNDRVNERIDRVNERMDERFSSISTKIHWALGIAVTVGIGVAGILIRLFFG